jgi:hypothetical protein
VRAEFRMHVADSADRDANAIRYRFSEPLGCSSRRFRIERIPAAAAAQ